MRFAAKHRRRNILVSEDGDTLLRSRAVVEAIHLEFPELEDRGPAGPFDLRVQGLLTGTMYDLLTPPADKTCCVSGPLTFPYPLTITKIPFWVGRGHGVDLPLCPHVSRRHAVVYTARGRLHVRDLGSLNGTCVNGRRVRDAVVRERDVVAFAEVQFHLQLRRSRSREVR